MPKGGRVHACVLVLLLAAGCGGEGPTSPSGAPPVTQSSSFSTGPGAFNVASSDDACTAKTPAWGFQSPRAVIPVVIATDAGGWIARSESPRYGDIELRLRLDGSSGAVSVSGSARGTAIDLFSLLGFPNPSRVTVSGASGQEATLTGAFLGPLAAASGELLGTLIYTDNQGGVMTCSAATWFLFEQR